MSHAPQETGTLCARGCGRPLFLTFDAIGRIRARCASCEGVNFATAPRGTVGPLHRQQATSSYDRQWQIPGTRCRDCGVVLLTDGRKGRPRVLCEDQARCRERRATPSPQHGTAA